MKDRINIGIIELPQSELLKFLQYPDGKIRAIDMAIDKAGIIRIQLEHPEMPEVEEGYYIPTLNIPYTRIA